MAVRCKGGRARLHDGRVLRVLMEPVLHCAQQPVLWGPDSMRMVLHDLPTLRALDDRIENILELRTRCNHRYHVDRINVLKRVLL
jgi:hypothetical protein